MKKIIFSILLILVSMLSFSDYFITRGPWVGEIYFIGLTFTGAGIYYSTDFGNSAICVDSTTNATGVLADLTSGVIYYRNFGQALYISTDYGQQGTWQLQNGGIYPGFNGGRFEGEIYNVFISHSDDFGQTFIPHSYNGFFGNYIESEIDIQANFGYILTYKSNVADSIYLLKSVDNFENLYHNKTFAYHWNEAIELTRGSNQGELYLFNHDREALLFSFDYADTWINLNNFNFGDFYGMGVVGGRSEGEVYIKCDYVNMMWQNAHSYILYSNDYGVSFEVFHPFSKGQSPLLSNFSAKPCLVEDVIISEYDSTYFVTGEMPLDVQFYNYSIGEATIYQWDFNNDGLVDSHEQSPIYTYVDTGWYSIKLTVFNGDDANSFIRENFIYVNLVTDVNSHHQIETKIYPNPFTDQLNIIVPTVLREQNNRVTIYNNNGENVRTLNMNRRDIRWDGKNSYDGNCPPGIYFLNINNKAICKILKTF